MKVPFRDLSVTDPQLKNELLGAVDQVLSHGRLFLGPEHGQFEDEIAAYCQMKYAVGVGSGSDALHLAMRSLDLKAGDEVILPPLSWIASLNAVVLSGATPVFVDIAEDLNVNADLIAGAITEKTKAILPVHFTGKLCDMETINTVAAEHGVPVVEDAAQAFGAEDNNGKAGSFGTLGCFSMNPMKLLCAYGEAGVVVTDDEELAERLRVLRYAGTVDKKDCHYPSLNGRLDTVQAAMLSINLKHLQAKLDRLRSIAGRYAESLGHLIGCPNTEYPNRHVYYTYTITTDRRDELQVFLESREIETQIQHSLLMPDHTAYRDLPRYDLPMAYKMVENILCIPNHDQMDDEQVEFVIQTIRDFFE